MRAWRWILRNTVCAGKGHARRVMEGGMSRFKVMTMAEIELEAVGLNCSVVVAQPNQLQFDLDTPEAFETWQFVYGVKFCNRFKTSLPFEEWASKSGHRHIVVTWPTDLTVPERIALQVMGGSDVGREFAALCCHWDGSPHPILLYRPLPKMIGA